MGKRKVAILAASAVMSISVAIGAAACGGSYELTDFIVNTSGVTLTYEVGSNVSLSGLTMTAKFSDDSEATVNFADVKFYLGDEDITANLSKITETKGEKKVRIVYTTQYGEDSVEITITVTEAAVQLASIDTFSRPTFISEYETKLADATNDATDEAFEQKFFKNSGVEYYVVGDDNAFKFLPVAETFNEDTFEMETHARFTADSTVKMLVENEYVTLTKSVKANETFVYEYYNGATLVLTEDAANNAFNFEQNAVGEVFKLSVKPDAGVYEYDADLDAVEFTVQVVDGYNVYKAGELSVFDNSARSEWTSLKALNGVADVATNGIILHQNTILTASDIPEAFQYTLPDSYNVKYKDENGNIGTPESFGLSRTYIKNQFAGRNPVIYERMLAEGAKFNFYGNYFDLDLTKVPLVAAFQPTGMNESETWYGNDFSNTALFRAQGQAATVGEGDEQFNFYNLAMKGNAKAKQLVLSDTTEGQHTEETLVYAGGVIGTKVDALTASYDNVRTYEFFIALFAENKGGGQANVNYNRTKIYDSFQDALFLWGKVNANVTNSYFKRAGGPLALMQHVDPRNSTDIPTLTIDDNSVMEAYLTGSEIWFSTVGGASVIDQFRDLDNRLLNTMGKTVFIGKTANGGGKMNMIALLTCSASNVNDLLYETAIQGKVTYKGHTLDRMNDSLTGMQVHGIMNVSEVAPIFSFGDAVYYTDGTGIYKPSLTGGDPTEASQEMGYAAYNSQYLSFYMGGLSVMFELGTYIPPQA